MLTLGNAACGFGAITFAARLGPAPVDETTGAAAVQASLIAAVLIYLAMLFDALDGSVARLMKQTSDLGAQLDSLCDAISFGVAPAFLMLQFVTKEEELKQYGGFEYPGRFLWTIAVLFLLCAILRLARFNVETDDDDTHAVFSGLPSPAAAGAVAAFPFAMPTLVEYTEPQYSYSLRTAAEWLIPSLRVILPLITLSVACLMVTRIRYPHFFAQILSGRRSRRNIIQFVFALAVIFWVQELAVPLLFCWFAFAAPIRAAWTKGLARTLYKPGAG